MGLWDRSQRGDPGLDYHNRITAVEASDKLTENQIVAKVDLFFSEPENRRFAGRRTDTALLDSMDPALLVALSEPAYHALRSSLETWPVPGAAENCLPYYRPALAGIYACGDIAQTGAKAHCSVPEAMRQGRVDSLPPIPESGIANRPFRDSPIHRQRHWKYRPDCE